MKPLILSFSVPFSCNLVSLGISLFPSFVLTRAVGGFSWVLWGRPAADRSAEPSSQGLLSLLASLSPFPSPDS